MIDYKPSLQIKSTITDQSREQILTDTIKKLIEANEDLEHERLQLIKGAGADLIVGFGQIPAATDVATISIGRELPTNVYGLWLTSFHNAAIVFADNRTTTTFDAHHQLTTAAGVVDFTWLLIY